MAKTSSSLPAGGNLLHNTLLGLNDGDYQHLTMLEKANLEFISNKQNSLSLDGTGTKYPTVDAVNAGISAGTTPDATTTIKGKLKLSGDLSGTADVPTVPGLLTKQNTLVSGTNIKTIEGQSLLGAGNIDLTKSDIGLNNVDNTSDLNKPVSNATQSALNLKQNLSEKNQINGYAGLGSDGKLISSQIPAIAITDTFVVSSESAMLLLTTAEQGDVAIRTDINKTFILQNNPYSVLANWKELLSPTDSVSSVFGRQGVVVAVNGDYTTALVPETTNKNYQTDNQKLFNDATSSIQTQLDSKTTIGAAFTAGRIPYTTSPNTIVDSSRLLWANTSSILEINGSNPIYRIKNNLNNYFGEFNMNAGGTLFYKNHQGKNIFTVTNPVSIIEQPQFAIGQVSVVPVESQLYVYGGTNGANIDARGLDTVDEANIDLQGNDWESSGVPNSLGFSYFGSNGRPGTVLGYAKNKLAQIRFQNSSTALITSINEDSSITPIRFGINTTEVASISNSGLLLNTEIANTIAGFDATKQVKSLDTSIYPNLTELSYVKGVTSSIQTQLNTKALDSNVVHKTGTETITGIKTFANTNSPSAMLNASVSGTGTIAASIDISSSLGTGLQIIKSAGVHAAEFIGLGSTSGSLLSLENTGSATNRLIRGVNTSGVEIFTVSNLADVTANKYIKSGGTSSQFLMADGSVNSNIYSDNSTGAVQGFTVTNNGNGTVNIASGTAYLKSTNDPYAPLVKYTIPAVTNLTLTDNANNYILVDYNGGSPALTLTTNTATINTETNSLAIVISRVGTTLDYISLVGQNVDANAKLRIRFLNQEGIRRANGANIGFVSRSLTLTSGVLFSGLIRLNSPSFDTSVSDTFTQVYYNGTSWVRTTGQTQVNNTQYNNGGVLTNLGNNDYRTDYIYLLPNNPSKLYLVLGTASYTSLTAARTASIPATLPSELQSLGLLVGRSIIQRLGASITEVSSAFDVVFSDSSVPNHNDLLGIQGGAVGDYQHLTTAEKALVTGSVQGTGVNGQVSYWTGAKLQAGSSKFLYNEPTNVLTLNASSGFFDVVKTINGTTASPSFENILRYGSINSYSFIQGGNSNTTDFGTYLNFVVNSSASNSPINAMTILPSGSLGIRTLTPNFNLHLNSPTNSTYFQITSALSGTTNVDGLLIGMANNNDAQFINRENSSIQFHTNNTEKVRIQGDGNVGIGTSSPLNRIHISGDTFNNSRLVIERTSVGTTGRFSMGVQNTTNQFGISDEVQGLDRLVISPTGLIGMGITSPNYNLHINSANVSTFLQISSATTGNTLNDGLIIGNDATGNALFLNRENTSTRFSNNNVEVMRIHPSGGVSIGNTTDLGAGTLNVTGNITTVAGTTANHAVIKSQLDAAVAGAIAQTISSASTLTLSVTSPLVSYYIFTGTTATWTLPVPAGNSTKKLALINTGTGTVTVNTNAGATVIYNGGLPLVSTYALLTGSNVELYSDGSRWIVL